MRWPFGPRDEVNRLEIAEAASSLEYQDAGRAQEGRLDDPYQKMSQARAPALCPVCGLVFRHGRWGGQPVPSNKQRAFCPACRRTGDDHPTGVPTLEGTFVMTHENETARLIRDAEEVEKRDRPITWDRSVRAKRSVGVLVDRLMPALSDVVRGTV